MIYYQLINVAAYVTNRTQVEFQERRRCHVLEHNDLDPRIFVLYLRYIEEHELSANHKSHERIIINEGYGRNKSTKKG